MSLVLKYSSGSTYTLVSRKVTQEYVQDMTYAYHTPATHQVLAKGNGLSFSQITITGDATSKTMVDWHNITGVSFDSGTTYQTVVLSNVEWDDDCWSGIYPFSLTLLACNLRESAVTRFPPSGYQFGDSSISSVHHHGNATAYPIIHLLPPLFFAPLTSDLYDFSGQALTLTRALAKVHGGVSYAANVPIYDEGLYISSETSQDTPILTGFSLTDYPSQSLCLQLKQTKYPTAWVAGATGGNLLTANQSNAETDTTGMDKAGGTLTRNTSTPLVGSGDFKLISTGSNDLILKTATTAATVTAGRWYCAQALVKCTVASGRKVKIGIAWYKSDDSAISTTYGAEIDCPTTATVISTIQLAPALAAKAYVFVDVVSSVSDEILYADSLELEELPATDVQLWANSTTNIAKVDFINNELTWTDGSTTLTATFPTSHYLTDGDTVTIVAHVTTGLACGLHCREAGGSWNDATGTLAALTLFTLTFTAVEGSISNLAIYPYILSAAEYGALDFSLAPLRFNNLYIGNQHAEYITKGSDGRLTKDGDGTDISGLVSGSDIALSTSNTTVSMSEGLSMRWYIEVKDTSIP